MTEPKVTETEVSTLSRRRALKTGAAVAGAALWVTPLVEALTVAEASAEAPSGRYEKPEKFEKPEAPEKP